MTPRWPPLSDDLLRRALTEEPSLGLTETVFHELSLAIERAPQRASRRLAWPWTPALPGLDPSPIQRRLNVLGVAILVALLVAVSIAIIGLVGAIQRQPGPLGVAGLIAFDSAGDIYVANSDGSGRRQLTSDPASDIQPTWSPDGLRIAYQSLDVAKDSVALVVMDSTGSRRTVVASMPAVPRLSGATIGWFRVSWSPDSRRLAYTAQVGATPEIFIVRADGSPASAIGDPSLEGHDPTWSPDGLRIAFSGGRFDDDRGIYTMNDDGSTIRRIFPGPNDGPMFDFGAPVWSPSGDRIALSAQVADGSWHVFVTGADGGDRRDISGGDDDSWGPAWSPDGTRIAYHQGPTFVALGKFVVAALDGSSRTVLPEEVAGSPTWSPDGTRLIGHAQDSVTGQPNQLVVIDVAKGSAQQIPAQPGGDASWQRLAP